jgi:fluoride exporter
LLPYLLVALGSACGGVLRFSMGRLTLGWNMDLPWTTIAINILGSCLIGFFGTLTLPGGRFAVSENARIFVMIGICGGFTTFSSFSLETYDLIRTGSWTRALANVLLSVTLCLAAVAVGHHLAHRANPAVAVADTAEEELTA